MQRWEIQPDWAGETVFIMGGGPSFLNDYPLIPRLAGRRVIVLNSSYETYPDADMLFFMDHGWTTIHHNRPAFKAFKGVKVTTNPLFPDDTSIRRLFRIAPSKGMPGLASDRRTVILSRTALQGALNICAHKGASRVILMGIDMQRAGERTHHHAPHKKRNRPGNITWDEQMQALKMMVDAIQKRGIEVINTSMVSRIPWWPKKPLSEVLDELDRSALCPTSPGSTLSVEAVEVSAPNM